MNHPSTDDRTSRLAPRRAVATLVAAIGIVSLAAPAAAQSKKDLERAEARATEGKAYFKSKLYKEAAEAFMDAYAIAKRPTLVYNAARAREELRDDKRAVALFTMYKGLKGVKADGRRAADKHIATLQKRIAATEKAAAEKAAREKAAADKVAAEKAARDKAAADKAAAEKAAAEKAAAEKAHRTSKGSGSTGSGSPRKSGTKPLPIVPIAGAGAAAAFAVFAQVTALGHAEDAKLVNIKNKGDAAKVRQSRDSANMWQGVAIGAGVVAVGLAGWAVYELLIASDGNNAASKRKKAAGWRVQPLFVPSESGAGPVAGALVRVGF